MRRAFWSLVMIGCTAVSAVCMIACTPEDRPVRARIAAVSRKDVHQVVAISGRLAYADEAIVCAPLSGVVERIAVAPGQRVGAGEALIRLESGAQEAVLSALNANASQEAADALGKMRDSIPLPESVIRAERACTVRQVLIDEASHVLAGSPVLRLSSNTQEIQCTVAAAELAGIQPGKWAWISSDGNALGFARVESIGEMEAEPLSGITCARVRLIPEKHIELPEGAAVDADVFIAGSDDVLALPLEAITPRGTVWWISDGRCTEISAEIVMCDEINAWVSLPEGMQVAIGEFKEGQRIMEAAE